MKPRTTDVLPAASWFESCRAVHVARALPALLLGTAAPGPGSSALAGPPHPRVLAVFDLQAQGANVRRPVLEAMGDTLATWMGEGDAFRVVPRDDVRRCPHFEWTGRRSPFGRTERASRPGPVRNKA